MRKGRVAALAGILAAAVGMGLFFPDLVVNVADQKMKDQEEHFSVDTTTSFADGRLTDMMRLAMSYVDEIDLYSGVEQSEGDVASIAENIAAKLSEDGVLPQMTYSDAETEAFVAVGEEQEMGVMWRCRFFDEQASGILEMLIDDRSGKLLFFCYQRPMSDEDPLYGYRAYGEEPDGGKLKEAALKDLQERSEHMENFCREYYGFTLSDEEYYADDAGQGRAEMVFLDAEGNRIPLCLTRDPDGTMYTWGWSTWETVSDENAAMAF